MAKDANDFARSVLDQIIARHDPEATPDMDRVSTSIIERHNLSVRMENRRFTRLTNAFSKRWVNHRAALALYFAYYNFCRMHKTLRCTPAMAAGVVEHVWTLKDLLAAATSL